MFYVSQTTKGKKCMEGKLVLPANLLFREGKFWLVEAALDVPVVASNAVQEAPLDVRQVMELAEKLDSFEQISRQLDQRLPGTEPVPLRAVPLRAGRWFQDGPPSTQDGGVLVGVGPCMVLQGTDSVQNQVSNRLWPQGIRVCLFLRLGAVHWLPCTRYAYSCIFRSIFYYFLLFMIFNNNLLSYSLIHRPWQTT